MNYFCVALAHLVFFHSGKSLYTIAYMGKVFYLISYQIAFYLPLAQYWRHSAIKKCLHVTPTKTIINCAAIALAITEFNC